MNKVGKFINFFVVLPPLLPNSLESQYWPFQIGIISKTLRLCLSSKFLQLSSFLQHPTFVFFGTGLLLIENSHNKLVHHLL